MQHDVTLEHAFLSIKDLDRTLAFYQKLLPDWVVRWEGRGDAGRWVHFGPAGDGQPGYLSLSERPAARPFEAYETLGPQHVGFAHADVDGLIARLRPAIEPSDYVDDGAYRRVYFEDPDGIELEFVQRL
ncbi:VOC family protein [Haliangium sp.]|uniref:VOC family protein n=1 Tax=Haliangium sp. TaxID=2663208 RepID=UPI003D0C9216